MKRQHVIAMGLGAMVLAVIGAALLLVLSDPTPVAPGETEHEPSANTAPAEPPAGGEKRRHAGHSGQATIRGRIVRGKKGVPVSGETVRLEREGTKGWSAVTGDDGVFRIERLPHGGPFTIAADVEGCAPVRLPGLALERSKELDVGDIRVDRAVSITIEVRAMDDSPIVGALVEAYAQAGYDWSADWTKRLAQIGLPPVAVTSLRTDANGDARFPAIASGTWAFRASAEGHARRGRGGVKLSPDDDEGREPIVIRLPRGHRLEGAVTDQDDAPIAGALVLAMKPNHAWSPHMSPLHHRAIADEQGRYAFDELAAGEFAIWAARPEGVPAQVAVLRVPDLQTFDVHLRLGGELRGQVTEAASGEPVAGVEVRATGWAVNSQRVGIAITDDDGRYVVDSMLEGIVQQVTVDRPGWVVVNESGTPWQQIALPFGGVVEHDIALRPGAVVTGTVSGPDGHVAEASVSLYLATNQGGWETYTAKTDSAGKYRIEGLGEGRGMVQARAKGFTQKGFPANYWEAMNNRSVPEEFAVDVGEEGEFVRDATLVRGGEASGTVKDAAGEPISGARVYMWAGGSTNEVDTDAEGAFTLTGLGFDAPNSISVSAEGFVAKSEQVTVTEGTPTTGLEFVLDGRATVRGTITTTDGSEPKGAFVMLMQHQSYDPSNAYNWQDPERIWDAVESTPAEQDGTFEIPLPLGTGKFLVRVGAEGFAPTVSKPIEIVAGQESYDVDLELGAGLTLTGRVIDAVTSEPVAGAYVALGTLHPQAERQPWVAQNVIPPLRGMTDADGRFALTCAQEGKFDVRVSRDGYVESKLMPKVPHSGDVDVKLQPSLDIRGTVRLADGTPMGGVQISYTRPGVQTYTQSVNVVSGDDGSFVVRDVSQGKYTITAQPAWGGSTNVRPKTVEDVAAGTSDLEIVVEPGRAISGTVLDPDGEGVGGSWVNAQKENASGGTNQWRGAITKADGTFEIVGLDEGTYTLHVNATSDGSQTKQVKGVAAGTADLAIRLEAGMEISGVLVDEQADPVSGVALYAAAIEQEGGMMYGNQVATTGSDGTFVLKGLAPGEYTIQRSNNGGNNEYRNHVLQGGGSVAAGSTGVRLVMSAGAAIRGTVVDAAGSAVQNVQSMWVKAQLAGGQDVKWASVNADGEFAIEGLAEDVEYTLRTMGGGFRPGSAGPVHGGTEGVQIAVVPGLSCSGRLVDSRGDGVADANITFRLEDSQDYSWAQTDDDGAFTASGMEDREYVVTAWIQTTDSDGNRTGQQRQVELGKVRAGETGVRLEVPEE